MAQTIVISAGVIITAIAFALAVVLYRLASRRVDLPVTTDWIGQLSMDRYAPMRRLLCEEDLGFDQKTSRRLREERCAIFRTHLRLMVQDFTRICTAIHILLLQAQDDRPDLAALLLKRRIEFSMALIAVNLDLFLYRWNIKTPDLTSLFKVFDSTREELVQWIPAPDPASA